MQKTQGATGGFFFVCYTVTKDGEEGFLKAFNFSQFLNLSTRHGHHRPIVDVIGEMIEAYRYERFLRDVAAGGTQPKHQEPWEHNPVTTDPAASEFHLDRTVVAPASRKGFHPVHIPEPPASRDSA